MRNKDLNNPLKYLGSELDYIKKVLQSESWSATGGNWNQELERAFALKIGTKYGVALNSGTSTLHASMEAAGVNPGDEVISPAITVMMDTSATLHANAVPVYVDVDPKTFTVDPEDLERKITSKTKMIITVGIYGLSPDMDPIMDLATKHGIVVVEDNAQCFMNTYKGKMAGTIGHMSSYSFENTKHISCGEGGIILTDKEKYAEMVRKIGGHGFKNLRAEEGRIRLNAEIFQNPDYKRHDELGWNYRLNEFSAAIALAQLERGEDLLDMRVKSAALFINVMRDTDYLIPQELPEDRTNSYYTLGVLYKGEESIGISWKDFRKAYVEAGGDGIYSAWSVPYLEPMMTERKYVKRCPWVYQSVYYEPGLCPVAERIQKQLMQFKTNYRDMKLAEMKADILQKVIKKFS